MVEGYKSKCCYVITGSKISEDKDKEAPKGSSVDLCGRKTAPKNIYKFTCIIFSVQKLSLWVVNLKHYQRAIFFLYWKSD